MKHDQDLRFACQCGEIRGHIKKGTAALHFQCECKSCAAAERHLGQPDPDGNGVPLVWVAPDRVVFDAGKDKLSVFRLTQGPVLRWYAACCGVPMMNFATKPRIFVIGLMAKRFDDVAALGPIQARSFVAKEDGKTEHKNGIRLISLALGNTISAAATGRWPGHPLLEAGKTPIKDAPILDDAERAAAGL